MNIEQSTNNPTLDASFEQAVINSALWAAAGDALGWITELARGQAGVKNRVGTTKVKEPVAWQRMIGGRNGPKVDLPAGTYSDDTQLRLAVSRSIRGNGLFDVETFAKIEITVWPTYALGGGLGTKAAAVNLSRRGVNWFSNFFERGTQKYITGGGNGAAMRIQPHIWASRSETNEMLLNVLRDSLVTHGHPHGFCGAVFHALSLRDVLKERHIPGPQKWKQYVDCFVDLPKLISSDPQLEAFWRPAWENNADTTLESALSETRSEALHDIEIATKLLSKSNKLQYHEILDSFGCLSEQFRGSGFKTALAAAVLAYLYRDGSIEDALVCSANELESDTDTIATMTGALLGALAKYPPKWPVQDSDYIVSEARRLAKIALGLPQSSFAYPDIGYWNPPTSQGSSIGKTGDGLAIAGLGKLVEQGIEYRAGDAIWQWFTLPFGQTIIAKRKINLSEEISLDQIPKMAQLNLKVSEIRDSQRRDTQQSVFSFSEERLSSRQESEHISSSLEQQSCRDPIDIATDKVILSNFDDETLGHMLNKCIDSSQSVETAIAFVAIVAKAKLARKRRHR